MSLAGPPLMRCGASTSAHEVDCVFDGPVLAGADELSHVLLLQLPRRHPPCPYRGPCDLKGGPRAGPMICGVLQLHTTKTDWSVPGSFFAITSNVGIMLECVT